MHSRGAFKACLGSGPPRHGAGRALGAVPKMRRSPPRLQPCERRLRPMPARSAKGRRARVSASGLPAPGRALARRVLGWYDRRRRRFPWRARPGEHPDPYRVWLAEIMLQQTTTRSAEPYFEAFVKRWPTLDALAQAPLDAVLHAWQGLGYYARARNLHRTARPLGSEHGGRFPQSLEGLGALPGV